MISESLVEVRDWGLGRRNKGVLSFVQKSNMSPICRMLIIQQLIGKKYIIITLIKRLLCIKMILSLSTSTPTGIATIAIAINYAI
ncbi:hypothetical protein JYQ62_20235 [Nostoc sp. UHCC 0702]|nr:hypothetical protein JYQ62_20235 [Nostoc sp. UHCC 0702]